MILLTDCDWYKEKIVKFCGGLDPYKLSMENLSSEDVPKNVIWSGGIIGWEGKWIVSLSNATNQKNTYWIKNFEIILFTKGMRIVKMTLMTKKILHVEVYEKAYRDRVFSCVEWRLLTSPKAFDR